MKAVTHNGKFHADEVFATVVLQKLCPDMQLTRTREPDAIAVADIVYDVGGVYDHAARRYDHHQLGARTRDDTGLIYSAFGLVWDHYGLEYCEGDEDVWRYIDDMFVRGIDADDNGEVTTQWDERAQEFPMTKVIDQLNPLPDSGEDSDAQFWKAVELASHVLERMTRRVASDFAVAREVRQAQAESPDSRYAELSRAVTMNAMISDIDGLEFLLFPDEAQAKWLLYAVNIAGRSYESKCPLPESWAGLSGEELARVTGVTDAQFCHKNRFLAVAGTREGVLKLLEKALQS